MTNSKKIVSLLLAMSFLVCSTFVALNRSFASTECYQKPFSTVLNELTEKLDYALSIEDDIARTAYSQALFLALFNGSFDGLPEDVDVTVANMFRYADNIVSYTFDQYKEMLAEGIPTYSEEELENLSDSARSEYELMVYTRDHLDELRQFADGDNFRNFLIFAYMFQFGGPNGPYLTLFPGSMSLYADDMVAFYRDLFILMEVDADDIVATLKDTFEKYAEASFFNRTLDMKEFLERIIAYYGPQKTRLSGEPTYIPNENADLVAGRGFNQYVLSEFEEGASFYDIFDKAYEVAFASYMGLDGSDESKLVFADFMQAMYDYMYPDCTVITTTTSSVTGSLPATKFGHLFDVTGITMLTNVSNVSSPYAITNITGAADITRVSNFIR